MSEKCLFYSVLVKTIFESLDTGCSSDRAQLGYGSIMEALQAFSLRQACLDEFCIEVF